MAAVLMLVVCASPASAQLLVPTPTLSSFAAVTDTSITITWGMANAANWGYMVFRRPAGSTWDPAWVLSSTPHHTVSSASVKTFTDFGLSSGTGYSYFVCAVYSHQGNSSARECPSLSNVQDFATALPAGHLQPGQAPDDLKAAGISSSAIRVTWADRAGNDATGIEVRAGKGFAPTVVVATLPPGTTSYDHGGLDAGSTYRFQACAFNDTNTVCTLYATGQTTNYTPSPAPPPPGVKVPGPPVDHDCLHGLPTSPFSIRVTWCEHEVTSTYGAHNYWLYRRAPSNSQWQNIMLEPERIIRPGDPLLFEDLFLEANTTYHYKVCLENTAGATCNPYPTGDIYVSTWPAQARYPGDLEAEVQFQPPHDHSVRLSWTNTNWEENGLVEFVVRRWSHTLGGWTVWHSTEPKQIQFPGDLVTYFNEGLASATEYRYLVCAYNEPYKTNGVTPDCAEPVTVTTLDSGIDTGRLLLAEHVSAIRAIELARRMPSGALPRVGEDCLNCPREFSLSSIRTSLERSGTTESVTVTLYNAAGASVADLGTYRSYLDVPGTITLDPGRGGFSDPASGCGYRLEITGSDRMVFAEAPVCLQQR